MVSVLQNLQLGSGKLNCHLTAGWLRWVLLGVQAWSSFPSVTLTPGSVAGFLTCSWTSVFFFFFLALCVAMCLKGGETLLCV